MSKTLFYPAGSKLIFTTGAYSDFSVVADVVALKDCDIHSLVMDYLDEVNPNNLPYRDDPDGFPAWLIKNGYAEPLDCSFVHLGEYGELRV